MSEYTNQEFENTYSLDMGINLINSGDDFRRIEVE